MIVINNAGTGCCIGTPVIMGYREETKDIKSVIYEDKSIMEVFIEILNYFNPTKEEPIIVCRCTLFKGFISEYKNKGYNIIPDKIEGNLKNIAENIFIKHLYSLGLSKEIVLHDNDYKRLHNEILDDILKKPKMVNVINSNGMKMKSVRELLRKLDRLINEFPNIYKQLLDNQKR